MRLLRLLAVAGALVSASGVVSNGQSPTVRVPPAAEVYQELTTKGLWVGLRDLRLNGQTVTGVAAIDWEERILGTRVVLIRGEYSFSFVGRQHIYEDEINLGWGVKVKVWADVYFEAPRSACLEVRAEFPGGNVGDRRCKVI